MLRGQYIDNVRGQYIDNALEFIIWIVFLGFRSVYYHGIATRLAVMIFLCVSSWIIWEVCWFPFISYQSLFIFRLFHLSSPTLSLFIFHLSSPTLSLFIFHLSSPTFPLFIFHLLPFLFLSFTFHLLPFPFLEHSSYYYHILKWN